MASRGSVIPLFVQQVKEGKPLTVTDPNMTRFLMSIDDAVDLVLYAFNNARQGDLFVQKAPASTIGNLATAIQEIFKQDADVKIIGTRHGEKLYETLVTREELTKAEDCGDYFRIPVDGRDLNYNKYFAEGVEQTSHTEDYNSHNTRRLNVQEVKELLSTLHYIKQELAEWKRA
jgi:UDP-glucose 4-epimerase